MKRFFLFFLIALTLTAFGCQKFGGGSPKVKVPAGWTTFESVDYGFSVSYPNNMELKERSADQQDSTYAGLQGKFFLSLRETEREAEPTSLALFYAMKEVDFEKFNEALVASDQENITIKETVDITQGEIAMKKIISTTAIGMDKTHYLFVSGENLIVISIVLGEEEVFKPVFETLEVIE